MLEPGYRTLPESLWEAACHAHDRGRYPDAVTYLRQLHGEIYGLIVILRRRKPQPTKMERCKGWLVELLGTVSRPARLVYREGERQGFNHRMICRALKALGAVRITAGCRRRRVVSIGLPWILAKALSTSLDLSTSPSDVDTPPPPPTTTKPFTRGRFAAMSRRAEKGQDICNPADHDLAPNEGFTPIYSADNTNNKAKPGPVVPEEDGRDVVEWKGQKDRKHWRRK